MKNLLTIATILIFSGNVYCQEGVLGDYDFNTNVDSLLTEFKTQIQINQNAHSGDVWWDDELRITYYCLMDIAPIDTLVKYTDDTSAAVRCSMFNGLAHTNIDESKLKEILDAHINDTVGFKEFYTDVGLHWTVKEYMELLVKRKSEQKLQKLDYKSLIARIQSYPKVVIEGSHYSKITRDDLLKLDSLKCSIKEIRIISFTFITVRNSKIIEKKSKSSVFTAPMRRIIRKLKPDDKVYIEGIRVSGPDGNRHMAPINLRIL